MIFTKDFLENGAIVKWRNGKILIYNKEQDSLFELTDLTLPIVFFNLNYDNNLLYKDRKMKDRDIVAFNNSSNLMTNISAINKWQYIRFTKEDFLKGLGYKSLPETPEVYYLLNWSANSNFSFKIDLEAGECNVISKKKVYNEEDVRELVEAFDEVQAHYAACLEYELRGKATDYELEFRKRGMIIHEDDGR